MNTVSQQQTVTAAWPRSILSIIHPAYRPRLPAQDEPSPAQGAGLCAKPTPLHWRSSPENWVSHLSCRLQPASAGGQHVSAPKQASLVTRPFATKSPKPQASLRMPIYPRSRQQTLTHGHFHRRTRTNCKIHRVHELQAIATKH